MDAIWRLPIFITKQDIQSAFRQQDWQLHLVNPAGYVTRLGDEAIMAHMRKLNYVLCKRFLHRRFAEFPLAERFHWAGFFQGSRDAGTRHLHVLIHVPASVPLDTPFKRMKVKTGVQTAWLRARDDKAPLLPWPLLPWVKCIDSSAYSRAAATYVSRKLPPTLWEREEFCFSQ